MDNIYVIRERIEAVYGKHSKSFDKAFQFILAMITFTMINQNTGFMKSLSSPVISLGLAVVATFFHLRLWWCLQRYCCLHIHWQRP